MKPLSTAPRFEDRRLLTGRGQFVDDLPTDQYLSGYVVRSPYPHAVINQINVEEARQSAGVQLVLTGKNLVEDGVGGLPCASSFPDPDDGPIIKPARPVLATGRVRHVGEPVAFVVADTLNNAMEAAELIDVDYRELPGNSNAEKALEGAVEIWSEAKNNICCEFTRGDAEHVKRVLADSAHVTSIKVIHPRMAITPIEPRSAAAHLDAESGQLVLQVQTQGVHMIRRVLAENVLNIDPQDLRVITKDVGGSFGMKIFPYPEYALVLFAVQKIGQPVKWTATRTESFVSDVHARARIDYAKIGFDHAGRITAYRYDTISDLGAYLSYVGPSIGSVYAYTVAGHTYKIPHLHFRNRGVFTNATPTDAYRGAGKPETVCTLEQLIDKAAFELNIDRTELRRINFVLPQDLPYSMLNGHTIDSGDFESLLDRALELSKWDAFPERRKQASRQEKLRGIGLGMYMHSTGGAVSEVCQVKLDPNGSVIVYSGTQSGGQGHASALAGLVADAMEISASMVTVIQGDTGALPVGGGTGGSSLVAIAGTTAVRAARNMIKNTRRSVAELLEVGSHDLAYGNGVFYVPGTDRQMSLAQIAAKMDRVSADQPGCIGQAEFEGINTTHPCGAYVVELECTPETGEIEIIQLVGVDDIGRVLYPQLADGQLHGSWAQAIGTSLMECVQFDEAENGQVLSGSLMDYQIPRAQELPFVMLDKVSTLCATNDLGVKGVGEVANLGAPGAIGNALSDLFSRIDEFVVVDPPATPYAVWKLLRNQQP